MVVHLEENGQRYLATLIVCNAIAVAATIMRVWCKLVQRNSSVRSLHADDWFIIAATASYLGAASAAYWGLFTGSQGMEIGEITADLMASPSPVKVKKMQNYLESLFIGITILYLCFFLAKISVCLMYRRIFSTPQFRKACLILMAVSTAWFIATQVANLVMCIPIESFWIRTMPGRCLNFNLFSLITGIADIVIDTAILLLPVRAVISLQMPRRTKIMVSGIFLLGGFAILTSILRVAYQYQPGGYYVSFSKAELWLNIHAAITILCACLPVCKPVRDLLGRFIVTIRDKYYGSSKRFLLGGSRGLRVGSSKNSTDGDSQGYDMGSQDPKRVYPSHTVYQHPTKGSSSTRELVLTHPNIGHQAGAKRSDESAGVNAVPVPPQGIARTTRVEIV
ncbi:Rhodopsin domain-containing protein [Madurella fahalii]|uniref:Rhodopsin domain-containing protein n=1 Tax=Madurella fahalii TaxID=1157608 RepID=A0ABQ0GFI2_9PEZI